MTLLINLPSDLNVTQREAIGLDVIQFIKERTLNGLDINNNPFAPYKQSYKDTLDYKIGHGDDPKVNLKLTGEMLGTLSLISHGVGFIKLGFTDQEAAKKAKWIEAPTGQKFGKQPPRRFFGIAEKDLNKIIERYKSADAATITTEANRVADTVLRRILGF